MAVTIENDGSTTDEFHCQWAFRMAYMQLTVEFLTYCFTAQYSSCEQQRIVFYSTT